MMNGAPKPRPQMKGEQPADRASSHVIPFVNLHCRGGAPNIPAFLSAFKKIETHPHIGPSCGEGTGEWEGKRGVPLSGACIQVCICVCICVG
jgi:hypothetical protein